MTAIGRYELLKRIASGGMAEVFLARHSHNGIDKLVVVKRVLPQHASDPEYLRMFKDEARISAQLQHPNLVQMYEMGSLEGLPFMALEYLNGEDVRSIYKVMRQRGQAMRLDVVLHLVAATAAGLHYAHERRNTEGKPLNIVHRDVSPQNVIVTYEGGVKVLDFGIARSDNRQHETNNKQLKGKLSYMAPEQVVGGTLDRRTDVYALGTMLYELTTGRHPLGSKNEIGLMRAIIDQEPTAPNAIIPGYAPELSAIVLKAIEKDPERRFGTAQEFQEALEKLATKRGLMISSIAVSKFMHELFGERATAYEAVIAGQKPIEVLDPAPAIDVVLETDELPIIDGTSEALPTLTNGSVSRHGPVLLIELKGKLNEHFAGAQLGQSLHGDVVFDLANVERVTSYGVREWLSMLSACQGKVDHLYLARCSEAVVNQLSMIRKFSGGAEVCSFFAPYACPACGHQFQGLLDVRTHAAKLQAQQVPPLPCRRCGQPADFDDDPKSYLAFGPKPGLVMPGSIASVLAALDAMPAGEPDAEPVTKVVDGDVTRVTVRAALDTGIRWARILDGAEGVIAIDLTQATTAPGGGIEQLSLALRGLGAEVTRIGVQGLPVQAMATLGHVRGLEVESVRVAAHCERCSTVREPVVTVSQVTQAIESGSSTVGACSRCGQALRLNDVPAVAQALGVELLDRTTTYDSLGAKPAPRSTPVASSRRGLKLLVGAVGAFVLGLAIVFGVAALRPAATPARAEALPAWAREGIEVVGERAVVTLTAPPGAEVDAAKLVLARRLEALLPPETLALLSARAPSTPEQTLEASRRLWSARFSVEQRASRGNVTWAQVAATRWGEVEAAATTSSAFFGAQAVAVPLTYLGSLSDGAMVVTDVPQGSRAFVAGLRRGDLVLAVDGAPATAASLKAAAQRAVAIRVEARGVTRTLQVMP